MPKMAPFFSAFTFGEMDPLVRARLDIDPYYLGAEKMRNAYPLPQGALRRRPGTEFVEDIEANGDVDLRSTDTPSIRLVPYRFSDTQEYLLVFTHKKMSVFRKGVHQVTIEGTSFTKDRLSEITWAQSYNQMIVCHEDFHPRVIQRGGSHTDWTISKYDFEQWPTFAFPDGKLKFGGGEGERDHKEFLEVSSTGEGSFTLLVDGVETDRISFSGTAATTRQRIEDEIEALNSVDTNQVLVTIEDASTTALTASGRQFHVHTYGIEFKNNNGSKEWVLDVGKDATEGEDIPSRLVVLPSRRGRPNRDRAFSSARGWPRAVTFWKNRLWFVGTKDLPQTIWCSRISNFKDFYQDTLTDDPTAPFVFTADTDEVNKFVDVHAGRQLQVFATDAEFYVPLSDDDPIIPETFTLKRSSERGIREGTRVVSLDGYSYFLDNEGKGLRRIRFAELEQALRIDVVSKLSSHLIDKPTALFVRKNISTEEPDLIFIRNRDGTLVVVTSLGPPDDISAFSRWTIDGDVIDGAVVDDEAYIATRRFDTNNDPVFWLEKFDKNLCLDAAAKNGHAKISTAAGTGGVLVLSGFSWLDDMGSEIKMKLDGNLMDDIDVSGNITTPRAATDWEIGLDFPDVSTNGKKVWVRTHSIESPDLGQSTVGLKKRISEATLRLDNTKHIEVQGRPVELRTFGSGTLDEETPTFTGDKTVNAILGWKSEMKLELSQVDPFPMTVLGVKVEVATR